MINFFRKIRKKLADDNKPLKYMRYAIGEIILVVIGILIALQINNWNKVKESKMDEIRVLMNLEESFRQNILTNQKFMNENMRVPDAIDFLLNYMEKDLKYHDSLKFQFGNTTLTFPIRLNSNVFQSLKSKDFDLISNDSLKNQIISVYNTYDQTIKTHNNLYMDIIQEASRNIFNSRFDVLYNANYDMIDSSFEIDKLSYAMVPNDFEKLKNDKEYLYFLRSLKNQFFWYVGIPYSYLDGEMNQLLESIKNELKNLTEGQEN